jgi:hypothetical protein
MPHGSYSLGETTAAKLNMARLKCLKCGRRGQYRVDAGRYIDRLVDL